MKRRDFRESYGRGKHLRLEDGGNSEETEGVREGGGEVVWGMRASFTLRLVLTEKREKQILGHSPFVLQFPLSSRMTLLDTSWR